MALFTRKNPAKLQEQLATLSGNNNSFEDASKNEWKLKLDSAGNGTAVIRFLPEKDENSTPIIKLINHGFKTNGPWYIENCTSTHGDFDSCPVCKYIKDNDLYNTDKALYQKMKRKTSFWANILVIKDSAAPENEGKVFKYRFGTKIYDKLNAMIDVDVDMGETPVDVTCPFEGANFLLKVKQVSGFSNYDESKFYPVSAIKGIEDEAFQKELIDSMENLNEMIDPTKFKTFEINEEKMNKALGNQARRTASQQADDLEDQIDSYANMTNDKPAQSSGSVETGSTFGDDSDDDLDDLLNSL